MRRARKKKQKYMYATTLTSRRAGISPRRNRNLAGHRAGSSLGPVSTTLLLAVIIGVLALLYLTQITKTSVYGFQVSNLSEQRKELIEKQQSLQVEAARLRSIANIEQREVVGALSPESNPRFVNP